MIMHYRNFNIVKGIRIRFSKLSRRYLPHRNPVRVIRSVQRVENCLLADIAIKFWGRFYPRTILRAEFFFDEYTKTWRVDTDQGAERFELDISGNKGGSRWGEVSGYEKYLYPITQEELWLVQ